MVAKAKSFKMLVEIIGALNSSEHFCPVDPPTDLTLKISSINLTSRVGN